MGQVDMPPSFGRDLQDGFKGANAWATHGIAWLEDVQQFYRERSAIEKEYSAKLSALAKKYFEKKNRKTTQLSVGESPTLAPGSLESASLTTWATQLTNLEARASEHDLFANHLIAQVAEPLKYYGARFEDLRKRHSDFADKLVAERDFTFEHLRKVKGKYDSTCQELEIRRKKSESHYDKAKAQAAYQQQTIEMHNAKNMYLITINVTNKQQERYYNEYVPDVMDSLQDLYQFRTLKLNGLWGTAAQLEDAMLQKSSQMMQNVAQEITRNLPHLDCMMYIQHNLGTFQQAPNKEFEASPVWHDDSTMVVDEPAKVYLRNVLSKSKSQLGELRREVDKKRRDVDGLKKLKQRVRDGTDQQDEVEVVRSLFAMQEDLHAVDQQRLTAEVETATITAVVGDVTLGANSHNFKGQTFKIPTNCDLCGERIWGLSAKGFDCRDCGYTCHSKCEMKVPADCPGEKNKEERKKLKAERQEAANKMLSPNSAAGQASSVEMPDLTRSNTMTSLSSHSAMRSASGQLTPAEDGYADGGRPSISSSNTPGRTKHRIVAPPSPAMTHDMGGMNGSSDRDEKRGKMLYTFEANGDGELSVSEGREIVLVEADDGSGWIKVRLGNKEGIVPATYVDLSTPIPPAQPNPALPARPSSTISTSTTSSAALSTGGPAGAKKKGPAVAPRRGAKKLNYVEALFEYTAQSETEHSMIEGERFVLVKEDPGDGWVEVEKAGVTASVPASYVQAV